MKLPFRFKYFLSHLLISLTIAGLSLFLIFRVWYPNPFQTALGVGNLVIIMLAVDVVLGPLLTLVLAKEGKKGLKTDLIIIGIVQLSALFYGLYSIDKGRPVVIAFDVNRFEIVPNHTIFDDNAKTIVKQFADTQNRNIPIVAVRPAKDDAEFAKRMENELENGVSPVTDANLYQGVEQNFEIIQKESQPIDKLFKLNKKDEVDRVLASYPQADRFALVIGSAKNMAMLIDSKNKQALGVVDLRPW